MKTTNANSDFQDFSKCDYSRHWSWSNFFRHIAVCNSMLNLPDLAMVLEVGAADSPIEDMIKVNFNKNFLFFKTDANEKYADKMIISDVEKDGLSMFGIDSLDCVILTEVIEHFDPANAPFVLKEIYRVLRKNGKLLLTTPTPQKPEELLVWPSDHKFEYSWIELFRLLFDGGFRLNKIMPWSQHLSNYKTSKKIISNCLPESLNRAISSLSADIDNSRQIFLELRKEE